MLRRLIEFLKNNYPDTNINDYLNARYLQLTNTQLQQIAEALKSGELKTKPATKCPAKHFIFHFGDTLVLVQKDNTEASVAYHAELCWETDFLSVYSTRKKGKGFYFIAFTFDNDYQITLKRSDKILKNQIINEDKNKQIIEKVMPILKSFMSAISE